MSSLGNQAHRAQSSMVAWLRVNLPRVQRAMQTFLAASGSALRNGSRRTLSWMRDVNAHMQARAEQMASEREAKKAVKEEQKRMEIAQCQIAGASRWRGELAENPDAAFVLSRVYDTPTRIWSTLFGMLAATTVLWFGLANAVRGIERHTPNWTWWYVALVLSLTSPAFWILGALRRRQILAVALWVGVFVAILVANFVFSAWVNGKAT